MERRMPRPRDRAAFLEARYRSAAIWSFSGCCSTLPESPVAFFGPAAFSLIWVSRFSATVFSRRRPDVVAHLLFTRTRSEVAEKMQKK